MNKLYMDVSVVTLQMLAEKDQRRMSQGDAAASADARDQRKRYAVQRRMDAREEDAMDTDAYGAGLH